jgi:hypothetical protein
MNGRLGTRVQSTSESLRVTPTDSIITLMENPKPNEDKIRYTVIFKDWQIHGLGDTNHENPLKSNCL